jgi:hypothetical protein
MTILQRKKPDSTAPNIPLIPNPCHFGTEGPRHKFSPDWKREGATYLAAYVDGRALRAAGRVQREGQHQGVGHEVEGRPVPLAQLTALAQEVQAADRGMLIRVLCKIQCNRATCGKLVVNCCVVTPVAAMYPDWSQTTLLTRKHTHQCSTLCTTSWPFHNNFHLPRLASTLILAPSARPPGLSSSCRVRRSSAILCVRHTTRQYKLWMARSTMHGTEYHIDEAQRRPHPMIV